MVRLLLIRRAKTLGFTLADIAELIRLGEDGTNEAIIRLAHERAGEIAAQQRELAAVRERLERLALLCADGNDEDCAALRVV